MLVRLRTLIQPDSEVRAWKKAGKPVPPPQLVKQLVLREYAARYRLRTFVETGTYYGDTTAALYPHVDRAITIEISPDLAAQARRRFIADDGVIVLEGDSGRLLPDVLAELETSALFWLDGHYSGGVTGRGDEDTPIRTELAAVIAHTVRDHVILIDDARLFDGGDYPTLDEIATLAEAAGYQYRVSDDIIRLTPPQRH